MKNDRDKRQGQWGEALTANYLYRHGYKVLQHHFAAKLGELDLLAQKGEILAVVEVKLRTGDFSAGAEAVTAQKQQRIRKALGRYLIQHPSLAQLYVRYDICQITAPKGMDVDSAQIDYFENAFY